MSRLPPPSVTAELMYQALMYLLGYAVASVEEPKWFKKEGELLHARMMSAWEEAQREDKGVN